MTEYDKNPRQLAQEYSDNLSNVESVFETFMRYVPEGVLRDDYKRYLISYQEQAEFLKDYLSG